MGNPFKEVGSALLGIAPAVANVLMPGVGGALVGTALKTVGAVVGVDDPDPKGLAKKLTTALQGGLTPEQMTALKQADNDFAVRMKELDVDLESLHQKDRDSARRMQSRTKSLTAPLLAFTVMASFIGALAGVFMLATGATDMNASVATLVGAVVGYASAKADQICSFYFGSSEGGDTAAQHLADVAKGGK